MLTEECGALGRSYTACAPSTELTYSYIARAMHKAVTDLHAARGRHAHIGRCICSHRNATCAHIGRRHAHIERSYAVRRSNAAGALHRALLPPPLP
eukprot:2011687-Rhodomonas_salina.2